MTDTSRQHEAMDDMLDYSLASESDDSPNAEMRRVRVEGQGVVAQEVQ